MVLNQVYMRPASSGSIPVHRPRAEETELEIVPADINDARTLYGIDTKSFPEPWSLRDFENSLNDPGTLASIALSGGVAVGYVVLNTRTSNVDSVAVVPEARGQRLGQKLMVHALDQAREKGSDQCSLQVESDNAAAKHLYEKLGFEVTQNLPGYYYGRDGQIMTLDDLQSPATAEHLDQLRS